uniref:Uncharacterized protein n=1 Tax=Anguilla anguilla TaxID=7936 RepID=A0A0E9X285_ANGAN
MSIVFIKDLQNIHALKPSAKDPTPFFVTLMNSVVLSIIQSSISTYIGHEVGSSFLIPKWQQYNVQRYQSLHIELYSYSELWKILKCLQYKFYTKKCGRLLKNCVTHVSGECQIFEKPKKERNCPFLKHY